MPVTTRAAAADPRALWHRYWAIAAGEGAARGLSFRLRTDLEALAAVQRKNRTSGALAIPTFDPAASAIAAGSAVWIEAVDEEGSTAATCAARAFTWPDTTLLEEAKSLRLFYASPSSRAAAGDRLELPPLAPSSAITGATACFGALWVGPNCRSLGLTRMMAQLVKGYAVAHWPVATGFALLRAADIDAGYVRAFGDVRVDAGGRLRLGALDVDVAIAWQRRSRLVAELEGSIAQPRRIETTLT